MMHRTVNYQFVNSAKSLKPNSYRIKINNNTKYNNRYKTV